MLKPGMMKGPHASMPQVDDLPKRLFPRRWNNVPIPVVEGFEEIMKVFADLKQVHFNDYNNIVTTQRFLNTSA